VTAPLAPVIRVSVTDSLYFVVTVLACGCGWTGMRHTDDVAIIVNRAMDHDHAAETNAPEMFGPQP
jgi:hypothetical protein